MTNISVAVPDEVRRIIEKDSAFLVPRDLTGVLHTSDMAIRAQARAGMLGFPTLIVGRRVKIPKIPFLRWLGYEITLEED